jgi:hypothetical protein
MIAASSAGSSALTSVTGIGASLRMELMSDIPVSPVKGRCPVAIS